MYKSIEYLFYRTARRVKLLTGVRDLLERTPSVLIMTLALLVLALLLAAMQAVTR